MNYRLDRTEAIPKITKGIELSIGEIAKIVDGSYSGDWVLKGYSNVMSLTHPNLTWPHSSFIHPVIKLEPGEKLVLVGT